MRDCEDESSSRENSLAPIVKDLDLNLDRRRSRKHPSRQQYSQHAAVDSLRMDSLRISAKAEKSSRLGSVINRQHSEPERHIEKLGTMVAHKKPTEIERLLLDDLDEQSLQGLEDVVAASRTARFNLVMALILTHRWSGHIEDELCLKFLTWALINEHYEVLELLVKHLSQLESYAYSMLELAVEDGNTGVIQLLLSSKTSVSLRERRYGRLLRTAVYLGHYQIVRLLLDRGADANFSSPRHGHILWIAAKAGHAHIVHLLVKSGAEVNRRALEGASTPLQVACFHRQIKTAEVLLGCNADVSASGAEYGTALEAAMYWPHSNRAKTIVQMLQGRGATV